MKVTFTLEKVNEVIPGNSEGPECISYNKLSLTAGQGKIKGFVEFPEWMRIKNTAEIVI